MSREQEVEADLEYLRSRQKGLVIETCLQAVVAGALTALSMVVPMPFRALGFIAASVMWIFVGCQGERLWWLERWKMVAQLVGACHKAESNMSRAVKDMNDWVNEIEGRIRVALEATERLERESRVEIPN